MGGVHLTATFSIVTGKFARSQGFVNGSGTPRGAPPLTSLVNRVTPAVEKWRCQFLGYERRNPSSTKALGGPGGAAWRTSERKLERPGPSEVDARAARPGARRCSMPPPTAHQRIQPGDSLRTRLQRFGTILIHDLRDEVRDRHDDLLLLRPTFPNRYSAGLRFALADHPYVRSLLHLAVADSVR